MSVAAAPPKSASVALVVLVAVFSVNYMDRQILAILIEPIRHDLHLTDTQAGLLYGLAFAVFYSVLGIPLARWADRSNRVHLIVGSVGVFGVMTAVCGAAGSFAHLLLARIGVAAGEAGTNPASHSLIADLFPLHRRSTAMSILGSFRETLRFGCCSVTPTLRKATGQLWSRNHDFAGFSRRTRRRADSNRCYTRHA